MNAARRWVMRTRSPAGAAFAERGCARRGLGSRRSAGTPSRKVTPRSRRHPPVCCPPGGLDARQGQIRSYAEPWRDANCPGPLAVRDYFTAVERRLKLCLNQIPRPVDQEHLGFER